MKPLVQARKGKMEKQAGALSIGGRFYTKGAWTCRACLDTSHDPASFTSGFPLGMSTSSTERQRVPVS